MRDLLTERSAGGINGADPEVHGLRTSRMGHRRRVLVGAVAEVLLRDHPAGQVGVGGVDAGVEDRDLHALAGETTLPGFGGTDLRHALVGDRPDPVVEADGLYTRLDSPAGTGCGHRGPELTSGRLVDGDTASPDAVEQPRSRSTEWFVLYCARSGGRSTAGVGDDDRHRAGVRVVVAGGEQRGDVEQVLVEAAGSDLGGDTGWQGVDVVAVPEYGSSAGAAALAWYEAHLVGLALLLHHLDLVTGEQGDRTGLERLLGGGLAGL